MAIFGIAERAFAAEQTAAAAAGADPATVPTFSFSPNDSLAQLIVDAWVDKDFRESLLAREADRSVTPAAARQAKVALAGRVIYLQRAVVITEQEYDDHYVMKDPNEVVFVLANPDRMTPRSGQSLQAHFA